MNEWLPVRTNHGLVGVAAVTSTAEGTRPPGEGLHLAITFGAWHRAGRGHQTGLSKCARVASEERETKSVCEPVWWQSLLPALARPVGRSFPACRLPCLALPCLARACPRRPRPRFSFWSVSSCLVLPVVRCLSLCPHVAFPFMTQLRCSSIDPYTGHHRRLNAKIRPLLSMRVHEHIRYVSGRFVGSPAHAAAHQQQPCPPTATEAAAAAAAAAGPLFSCCHCDAVLAIYPAAPQAQALVEVGGPPCPCEIPLPCAVPWHALSYLQAGAGAERVRYGERLTMNRRCAASNSVRHAGGRNGGRHSRQLRTAEAGFLFSDDETHTRTPAKPPMPRPWLVAVFHAPPFHLSASTSKPRPALLGTAWPDQLHHRRRPWTGLLAILRAVRSPRNFISTEDIAVASLLATVNKRVEMYQCSAVFFFFSAFLGRPRVGTSHSHRRYGHASTLRTSVKPPIACRENRWRNLGGEDGLGRQRKQVVCGR